MLWFSDVYEYSMMSDQVAWSGYDLGHVHEFEIKTSLLVHHLVQYAIFEPYIDSSPLE
jgi:hypothetical protein